MGTQKHANHGTALASINVPALAGFGKAAPKTPPKPAFAYGLPGGANILGEFDPAGFLEGKSQLEVYRYREAELTYGRVSMLASLGFIVQEKFHPLFSGDGGPAIDQIPALPAWLWVVMIGGIGFAESQRISIGWQVTGSSPHPHTGQGVQGKVCLRNGWGVVAGSFFKCRAALAMPISYLALQAVLRTPVAGARSGRQSIIGTQAWLLPW